MFVAFWMQIRFFSLELHKCPIFAILLWYCLQFKQTIHNVVIFVRKLKNSWIHCNGQTIYTVDLFLIERSRRFFLFFSICLFILLLLLLLHRILHTMWEKNVLRIALSAIATNFMRGCWNDVSCCFIWALSTRLRFLNATLIAKPIRKWTSPQAILLLIFHYYRCFWLFGPSSRTRN